MSALRESSGRRLSVLDEVLRAQARYRAWRRLRRAGVAGALLLLTVLVSLLGRPGVAARAQGLAWQHPGGERSRRGGTARRALCRPGPFRIPGRPMRAGLRAAA